MSAKTWAIQLDGQQHQIVVHHGYFSARRQIYVDGSRILDVQPDPLNAVRLWNTATEHSFQVAGHSCSIRVDPTIDNATYKKQLIVDGHDVDTGVPITPLPLTNSGVREGRWLAGYGGLVVQPFALAAIVLGQLAYQAHHQIVWYAAGFGGAAVCWAAGRIVGESNLRKASLSAGVVVVLFALTRPSG